MKSSTYGSVVTIVFLTHKDAMTKSIESAIRATDALCKQLGITNNLSHMTKYRIISDLIQSRILVSISTSKKKKVRLSGKISSLFP
jgi:hypothetical protein